MSGSSAVSRRLKFGFLALSALDTVLAGSGSAEARRCRILTKPMLMPLLAGSLATAPGESTLRGPVLAAQSAGWVGDVALLSERKQALAIGSVAFAVGHAAYISGFRRRRTRLTRLVDEKPARALAGYWVATMPMVAWRARRQGLAPVVAAYSLSLTSMVVAATRLDGSVPVRTRRLAAAGALLFLASDSILGARKFLLEDAPDAMEAAVMATYAAGQFLLSEAASQ